MTIDTQRKALEAFLIDNPDLERLELQIAEFNLFEAIGMIQQEIRHSHFLAMLLDPSGNHGLDDLFLKRLLMSAVRDSSAELRAIDLDLMDLSSATVQREWQTIDILITDQTNNLVCIIENKLFTGEHDNQLHRYYDQVHSQFPGW